jgi:hypothetical protein
MQIGSGSTALAKAGAGGAMVTFLAGLIFDATYPQTNNLGAGLGVEAVYKTTFPAGTGTGTVNEATITNGTISTGSTVGNTIGRITPGAITGGLTRWPSPGATVPRRLIPLPPRSDPWLPGSSKSRRHVHQDLGHHQPVADAH